MSFRAAGLWWTRTNLFRRGQCDATTDWSTTGSGSTSVAVDATVDPPFCTQSIKYTTDGAAANQGAQPQCATGQAIAAGTSVYGSIYFKGVAGQSYSTFIQIVNTDASTTLGTSSVFTATGEWQLVTPATVAVAVGKTGDKFGVIVRVNGTRAESFWVAHAMLEKGVRQVSPYIPTSGGKTASRPGGRRWQLENARRMMHRYAQVWP